MTHPADRVQRFLESWRPLAELPPGNPVRRTVLRFVATEEPAERRRLLERVSPLYRLHGIYESLGILREQGHARREVFRRLLALSIEDFARALEEGRQKDYLALLMEGFEFGRQAPPGAHAAAREFLLHLWSLEVGGQAGLKYSVYPNGVLFTTGGQTHDEMAREFNRRGFGSGNPVAGGTLLRQGPLAFCYDTHSTFVRAGGSPQKLVAESLQRWIRATGGDAGQVGLTYLANVAQA